MFITIQYPLFDKWGLQPTTNRADLPNWHDIESSKFVSYLGNIVHKQKEFNGPLDTPSKYCDASYVFNLCGLSDKNFHKGLQNNVKIKSKIISRRFQADGYFMARFEIAFSDFFENKLEANIPSIELKSLFLSHINKYLECELKIKVGTKKMNYVPIADAGKDLKKSYFWSTVKGNRNFNERQPNLQIENINPIIIVQVNKKIIPIGDFGFEKIDIVGINNNIFELYRDKINTFGDNVSNLWIIGVDLPSHSSPMNYLDFKSFSEQLNYLRKNLLFIPANIAVLQKLSAKIQDFGQNPRLSDFAVQWNIARYFKKSVEDLAKDLRNRQNQNSIIRSLFKSDYQQDKNGKDNVYYEELKTAIDWFNALPSNDNLIVIKKQIEENYSILIQKIKPKIYISSTFRDLKEYRADLINLFQKELSKQFEMSQIMEKMYDDGDFTPFTDDCIGAVKYSDIYLIILGNKTGSFPPGESRTYTEIELDTAILEKKKIFCFRYKTFDEKEIDNKTKHDQILDKFKGKNIHSFSNYLELENLLLKHLIQLV